MSDKERAQQLDSLFRDVVNVLVEKCINRDTQRPYPSGIIERSLRDLHFAVDPTKPAKVQALEALPELRTILPIERARMRLRVQVRDCAIGRPTGNHDNRGRASRVRETCLQVLRQRFDSRLASPQVRCWGCALIENRALRPVHGLVFAPVGETGVVEITRVGIGGRGLGASGKPRLAWYSA